MKKLWQKNWELESAIEAFETKGDLLMDQKLVKYDVLGSLAHAYGLAKIGILTDAELAQIQKGLTEVLNLEKEGKFGPEEGDEDVHTKIENFLTDKYGEAGKKIHTGRSRNDQVLTAIRLLTKDYLLEISAEVLVLVGVLLKFAKANKETLMPGYTHMQKAMPSTFGMWAGALAEGLLDDLVLLKTAYELNDQSPLGSAAGYGVPLTLDRKFTAQLLGFENVQINSLYAQNSRGKIEAAVLAALVAVLTDINKLASDVLLFTTSEFGFLTVKENLTSGSSIMPQKKNVDVAELLRSKVHMVLGAFTQVVSLSTNLISGYNRDLQDTKKPLFESLETTLEAVEVAGLLVKNISVNKDAAESALTPEIFATHEALSLVKKGASFRKAYQEVGKTNAYGDYLKDKKSLLSASSHLGGIGNLGLDILSKKLKEEAMHLAKKNQKYKGAIAKLTKGGVHA